MELQADRIKSKKSRKLTRFMCQELLYDYVNGSLDQGRREAVEQYIPTCKDTMRELERLRRGVDYSRALALIVIPPKIMGSLKTYEPHWQVLLRKATLWSAERGWKFVAPAILLATFTSAIFVWAPWIDHSFNELARIEISQDSRTDLEDSTVPPQATAAVAATPALNPSPTPVASPETLSEAANQQVTTPENSELTTKPGKPERNFGSVYRAKFELKDLQNQAETIRQKLIEMGAELRPKGDEIFDFTLPESKLEELKTYLTTLGPVRLTKDKRPLEMPAGKIRIILLVKAIPTKDVISNEGAAENPPETP